MKLFIVAALLAVCGAAKLDRSYLPPASAKAAGGSPGAIQTPFSTNNLIQGNQGLGGIPKGGFSNDVQGVVVDAAAPGTRASGPGETGLGAPRPSYGSQNSKVGDAAFRDDQSAGFRKQFNDKYTDSQYDNTNTTPVIQTDRQPSSSAQPVQSERLKADQDRRAEIIRLDSEVGKDDYRFNYETDNGIRAEENGVATDGVKAQGSFAYTADDGQEYSVTYTADENGYRPQGAHLPTPPPIPEAILKSLEQNAKDEAAGHSDDGSYDAEKYNGEGDYNESDNKEQYNGASSNRGSMNTAMSSATFNSFQPVNTRHSVLGNRYQSEAGSKQNIGLQSSSNLNELSAINTGQDTGFVNTNNLGQQRSSYKHLGYLPPLSGNQKQPNLNGVSQEYSQSNAQGTNHVTNSFSNIRHKTMGPNVPVSQPASASAFSFMPKDNLNNRNHIELTTVEQQNGQTLEETEDSSSQFRQMGRINQFSNEQNSQNRFAQSQKFINAQANAFVHKQNTDLSLEQVNTPQLQINQHTLQTSQPAYQSQGFSTPTVSTQHNNHIHQMKFQNHVGVTQASASKFTELTPSPNSQRLPQISPTMDYQKPQYNNAQNTHAQHQQATTQPRPQLTSQKSYQQKPNSNRFVQPSIAPQSLSQISNDNQLAALAPATATISSPSQQYNGEIYHYTKPEQTLPPSDSTPQSSVLSPTQAAYQETEQRFGQQISGNYQLKGQNPQQRNQFAADNNDQSLVQSQQSHFSVQNQPSHREKQFGSGQDLNQYLQGNQNQKIGSQNQHFSNNNQETSQPEQLATQKEKATSSFTQQFAGENEKESDNQQVIESQNPQFGNQKPQFGAQIFQYSSRMQNHHSNLQNQQPTSNLNEQVNAQKEKSAQYQFVGHNQQFSNQNQQLSNNYQSNDYNQEPYGALSQRFGSKIQSNTPNSQQGYNNQRPSTPQNQQYQESDFGSQFQGSLSASSKFTSSPVSGKGEYFEPSREPPSFNEDTGYQY